MEEDVMYPAGKEEVETSTSLPSALPSADVQLTALPSPSSVSAPFSSPDDELFFLVCSLVRSYGLHDSARQLWQQRHLALHAQQPQLQLDAATPSDDLPLPPHPSLPGDALRLLAQSLLKPASSLPDDSPRLPPSFLHSGRQALLPHFRSHPLRPILQSPLPSHTFPTFSTLRALHSLPSSPSCLRPSLHHVRFLHSSSLIPQYRPLKLLLGHLLPVYSVIFDTSGDLCATGSDDHLIKVWSTRTARLLLTLRGHEKEVTDLAISPDNDLLASASWDHSVRVWALRRGGEPYAVFFHHHSNKIWRISFHPQYSAQRRLLFTASMDGSAQIFDLNRPEQPSVTLFAHPQHLSMPDHLTAFTTEEAVKAGYHFVITPHLTTINQQRNGPARGPLALPVGATVSALPSPLGPAAVPPSSSAPSAAAGSSLAPEMLCVTHHPSGEEFALGSNDRGIRLYSTSTCTLVAVLKGAQGEIDQLHYDYGGDRLLSVDDSGDALIWERVSQSLLYRLLRKERGDSIAFSSSPVGGEGTDESSMDSTDSTTALPAITRFQCVGRLRILSPASNSTANHSADGGSSSTAPADSSIAPPPSSSSLAALLRPPSCRVTTACWGVDDGLVLTSSSDGVVRAWKVPPRGKADQLFLALHRRQRKAHAKAIRNSAAATSPAPPVSLTLSRRSFFVHTPLLSPFASFVYHTHTEIPVVRVHPTLPSVFLSAGLDGLLCLWDVDRRVLLRSFHCPPGCRWIDGAFSPLGDLIALTGEEGHLAFFGFGSRVPYTQAPREQFLKEDYHPLVRDEWGYVLDAHTQLPPHLLGRVARILIRADGTPYDPQPVIDALPDAAIPRTQPQVEGDGEASNTLSPATSEAILAADLARASRLAQLRLQRRLQWQQLHRSANDMATLAAGYRRRRQLEDPIVLDGAEEASAADAMQNREGAAAADDDDVGWWNDRPTEDGQGEAVDVEDDVAEEDEALDAFSVPVHPYVDPTSARDDEQPWMTRVRARREEEEAEGWVLAQQLVDEELALMEVEEDRKDEDFLPLPAPPVEERSSAAPPRSDSIAGGRASRAEERARRRGEVSGSGLEEREHVDDEDVPLHVRMALRRSTRVGGRGGGRRSGRGRAGRRQEGLVNGQRARVRTIEYKEDDWDALAVEEDGEGDRDDDAGQEWHEEGEDEDGEEEADDSEEDGRSHARHMGDDGDDSGRPVRAPPAGRRSERVEARRVVRRMTRRMSSVESTPVKEGTRRSTRKRRRSSSYREVGSDGEEQGYDSLEAEELARMQGDGLLAVGVEMEEEADGEDGWQSSSSFQWHLRTYHTEGDVYELVTWGRRVGEEGTSRVEPVEEPPQTDQPDSTPLAPLAEHTEEPRGVALTEPLTTDVEVVAAAAEPAEEAKVSDLAASATPTDSEAAVAAAAPAEAPSPPAATTAEDEVDDFIIRIRRLQRMGVNGHTAASVADECDGVQEGEVEPSEPSSPVEQPRWRWVNWLYAGRPIYKMRMRMGTTEEAETGESEAGEEQEAAELEPASTEPAVAADGEEIPAEETTVAPEVQPQPPPPPALPMVRQRQLRSRVVLLDPLDAMMELDGADAEAPAVPAVRGAPLSVR